jgi:hypothetical protein
MGGPRSNGATRRRSERATGRKRDRREWVMKLLSRRDERTRLGVLTPGCQERKVPPRKGGRSLLPKGGSIYATTEGYLPPLQGGPPCGPYLGLKPQAESFRPCGTEIGSRPYSDTPKLHHSWRQSELRTRTGTKPLNTRTP